MLDLCDRLNLATTYIYVQESCGGGILDGESVDREVEDFRYRLNPKLILFLSPKSVEGADNDSCVWKAAWPYSAY